MECQTPQSHMTYPKISNTAVKVGNAQLPKGGLVKNQDKPIPSTFQVVYTLPETNSSPLKMDGWNTTFLLGRPIFRGYVSFRECIYCEAVAFSKSSRSIYTHKCHDIGGEPLKPSPDYLRFLDSVGTQTSLPNIKGILATPPKATTPKA